jgi:hypothetical protein
MKCDYRLHVKHTAKFLVDCVERWMLKMAHLSEDEPLGEEAQRLLDRYFATSVGYIQ